MIYILKYVCYGTIYKDINWKQPKHAAQGKYLTELWYTPRKKKIFWDNLSEIPLICPNISHQFSFLWEVDEISYGHCLSIFSFTKICGPFY